MGTVLRITDWRIVHRAITGNYIPPHFPAHYEYRGTIASGKRKGCEVLIPRLKCFNPSNLTGIGKKGVRFIFQEPNSDWLKFLKINKISIADYKF